MDLAPGSLVDAAAATALVGELQAWSAANVPITDRILSVIGQMERLCLWSNHVISHHNKREFVMAGVIPPIARMLQTAESDAMAAKALEFIGVMASHQNQLACEVAVEAGVLDLAIHWLGSDSAVVHTAATDFIWAVSYIPPHAVGIYDGELFIMPGITELCHALPCLTMPYHALPCLTMPYCALAFPCPECVCMCACVQLASLLGW